MQIESEQELLLERSRRRRRARRKRDLMDIALKIPVRLLSLVPLIANPARREARTLSITQRDISLPGLPAAFDGLRLAFLTDLHAGPTTPVEWLKRAVEQTNAQRPDVVLLGGDYITYEVKYLAPLEQALGRLHAPLGVYGVLGNHDYWDDPEAVHCMLEEAGIVDVTNGGRWLHRDGGRLRIAGVDDYWEGKPDLDAALAGMKDGETAILLAHNPDFAVGLKDPRLGLVLSGHTHGGQICLPRLGPVITNSRHGRQVVSGHVQFESFQLYTSRGLGTVVAPMRYNCPPEIALLTLRAAPLSI